MKPQDDKRKPIQQLPDDREHVRFADLLAGGDELHLRHAVHRVDVIHAFDAVQIALMHAVYADVARYTVRLRGTSYADGHSRRICLGPVPPLVLIRLAPAQVVQVGNRDARQTLVARVAEHLVRALHELLGGGAGQRAVQHVRFGQQGHVCRGIAVRETPLGFAGLFR